MKALQERFSRLFSGCRKNVLVVEWLADDKAGCRQLQKRLHKILRVEGIPGGAEHGVRQFSRAPGPKKASWR